MDSHLPEPISQPIEPVTAIRSIDRRQILYEQAASQYEYIAERLSLDGKPFHLINADGQTPLSESENHVNEIFYSLGSLLENLAFQCSEKVRASTEYAYALHEVALISEFAAQFVEKNPDMEIIRDESRESFYAKKNDNVRLWYGSFKTDIDEEIRFELLARARTNEKLSNLRAGSVEESKSASFKAFLISKKHNICFRFDPDQNLCIDLDTPGMDRLKFDEVNQKAGHHFYTDIRVGADEFANMINVITKDIDKRVK
ncbi:MAG: hypothetical protein E6Q58_04050 [Niabella sp.]|nr:MAG: hypothetical protein E6Q58_04050 [Niabella sp.]